MFHKYTDAKMILVAGLCLQIGCASTNGGQANIDADKRVLTVYSTSDKRSPMDNWRKIHQQKNVVERLRARLREQPKDIAGWISLSQILTAQARFEEAESAARKALRIDIKNGAAKKVLAQIAVRRNQPKLATIILNGIEGNTDKDADILNTRALVALANNEPSQALALFQQALKLEPSNISVRMNLGVAYLTIGSLGLPLFQFERVLKIVPEHTDAMLHLAIISLHVVTSNRRNRL